MDEPGVLSCSRPYCTQAVQADAPEASEWERWTYADGYYDDLCPGHVAEVASTAKRYHDTVQQQDAMRPFYTSALQRYLNPHL